MEAERTCPPGPMSEKVKKQMFLGTGSALFLVLERNVPPPSCSDRMLTSRWLLNPKHQFRALGDMRGMRLVEASRFTCSVILLSRLAGVEANVELANVGTVVF